MSIANEITRIQNARNKIRTSFVNLGIATGTDDIDTLAAAAEGIENKGAVQATVTEGKTYTIPKGYHNGSGTVTALSDTEGDAARYLLQSKTVTPTKAQINITPDSGYYGMSDVTVDPIPDNFQDVTPVTATAGDVLATKIYVNSQGKSITGTMPNNGAVTKALSVDAPSYTIPTGYHNGAGKVSVALEEKSVSQLTHEDIVVTPTSGKVLSKVTVSALPETWMDTAVTDVSLTPTFAVSVLEGREFFYNGSRMVGTMDDNGNVSAVLSVNAPSYTVPQGYHEGKGTISIALEEKSVTPTKSVQNITPTSGKVLSKVSVAAIPANYITTTDATASAYDILTGKNAYVNGQKVSGVMKNNGELDGNIDGLTNTSFEIPAGYTSGGTISLTDDIAQALAAI